MLAILVALTSVFYYFTGNIVASLGFFLFITFTGIRVLDRMDF